MLEENNWHSAHGAEIGVQRGDNLIPLVERFPGLFMYAIDMWQPIQHQARPNNYTNWDHEGNYKAVHELASRTGRVQIIQDFSLQAAQCIADNSLHFAFIDADHSVAGVATDIYAYWPKIKPGGFLVGHDTHWPSVAYVLQVVFGDRPFSMWPGQVWAIKRQGVLKKVNISAHQIDAYNHVTDLLYQQGCFKQFKDAK